MRETRSRGDVASEFSDQLATTDRTQRPIGGDVDRVANEPDGPVPHGELPTAFVHTLERVVVGPISRTRDEILVLAIVGVD